METIRKTFVEFCEDRLPFTKSYNEPMRHWGEIGFDHIAKHYAPGYGTTCGFLPNYLMWRFGCQDNTLINRSEPAQGLTYAVGANLNVFARHKIWRRVETEAEAKALIDPSSSRRPKPGDFIIIRGEHFDDKGTDSSHIMVLLKEQKITATECVWDVAQTGASDNQFRQAGHRTTLYGKVTQDATPDGAPGKTHAGPNVIFPMTHKTKGQMWRRVIGWADIGSASYGGGPDPRLLGLFDQRWTEPANNNLEKIMPWLGLWSSTPTGYVPLAPDYIVLEHGHSAHLLRLTFPGAPHFHVGSGLWTRDGDKLTITWANPAEPNGTWNVTKTFVPREKTTGTPTGNTNRTLEKLGKKQWPDNLAPQWKMALPTT